MLPQKALIALVALCMLVASGCGGGASQNSGAPEGTWKVTVVDWKFAKLQPLGTPEEFVIQVRNDDTRQIPSLILTVSGLKTVVYQPNAASDVRPIWLLKEADYAHFTPYNSPTSTSFNLGPLDAGDTATYAVTLTPLRRGSHEVGYRLAPALFGDNSIVNAADGSKAEATRTVVIDPTPVMDQSIFKD